MRVVLHEMRPLRQTPAHRTGQLAELVCSNTFKSTEITNAHGLLKEEMRSLSCMVLAAADGARVPAGTALAVDRDQFATAVTACVEGHPLITVARAEVTAIPSPGIIATGPLTSDTLADALRERLGAEALATGHYVRRVLGPQGAELHRAFDAGKDISRNTDDTDAC